MEWLLTACLSLTVWFTQVNCNFTERGSLDQEKGGDLPITQLESGSSDPFFSIETTWSALASHSQSLSLVLLHLPPFLSFSVSCATLLQPMD